MTIIRGTLGKESTDVHIYLVQAESDMLCARLLCLPRSSIYDVKLKLFHQLYLKVWAEVYRDTKGMYEQGDNLGVKPT